MVLVMLFSYGGRVRWIWIGSIVIGFRFCLFRCYVVLLCG